MGMKREEFLSMIKGGAVEVQAVTTETEIYIRVDYPIAWVKSLYVNGQAHQDYTVDTLGIHIRNLPDGEKQIFVEYEPLR